MTCPPTLLLTLPRSVSRRRPARGGSSSDTRPGAASPAQTRIHTMKSFIPAALAAALTLAAPPGAAQSNIPTTLEEAYRVISRPESQGAWHDPGYREPPGNVRAEDMMALFGNTVMVARIFHPIDASFDEIKIIALTQDGRYAYCGTDEEGSAHFTDPWASMLVKTNRGTFPLMNVNTANPQNPALSPLYDAATGEVLWFTPWRRKWWSWNPGHLQERLPVVTWTLCPDFPSAEELGVGINRAQTATTYRELIAQDPGRRIKRPDLVTPNARLTYE